MCTSNHFFFLRSYQGIKKINNQLSICRFAILNNDKSTLILLYNQRRVILSIIYINRKKKKKTEQSQA